MFLNVRTLLLDVIPSQCRGSGQRGSILSNADAGLVPAITAGILTTEQLDCVQRLVNVPDQVKQPSQGDCAYIFRRPIARVSHHC
jgi:hypothetical protein